jgi:hypothetical protein
VFDDFRRSVARRLLPYSLWLARSLTPALPIAVVHGFPATEGNAAETVRTLEDTDLRRIYWLDSPGAGYAEALGLGVSGKVRHVSRSSVIGVLAYVVARFTFFTHGLYGVPPALARKPTINVWHGEAIKKFDPLLPHRAVRGRPADFHVGSTERFAAASAIASHATNPPTVIRSGYPRTAQLLDPATDAQLTALRIDPASPFVLWVPTFRRARAVGATHSWSDTGTSASDDLTDVMQRMVPELVGRGVQLVVKPHPLDAESRQLQGAITVTEAGLRDARVPFYRLVGRASGLVTDFSSIANEFLVLDRPIAYFFPDEGAYLSGRGLQVADALDHLAGAVVRTPNDMADFASEVRGLRSSTSQRAESRSWFGPLGSADSGARMVDALSAAGQPIRRVTSS